MRSSTTSPKVRSAAARREHTSLSRTSIFCLLTAAILSAGKPPAAYGADPLPTHSPSTSESSSALPDADRQTSAVDPRTPIRRPAEHEAARTARGRAGSLTGSLATLGLILGGLYVLLLWLRRRQTGSSSTTTATIDVLASRRLDAQGSLHLVRIGRRVLAIGSGPTGMRTLAEFDDPEEIALLMATSGNAAAGIGRKHSPHRSAPSGPGRDASPLTAAAAAGTTSLGRVA